MSFSNIEITPIVYDTVVSDLCRLLLYLKAGMALLLHLIQDGLHQSLLVVGCIL
jgi:hypothetical protein